MRRSTVARSLAVLVVLVCLAVDGVACGAARAQAQPPPDVDLILVLAVDASGSVNHRRFEVQKQGYVTAFRNPRVQRAIESGVHQAIAVSMVQWTGPQMQVVVVPWTLLKDRASLDAFADAIDAAPRQLFSGGTSISGAIDHARAMLAGAPYRALRRVIDISGDGVNNRGRPAEDARDEAVVTGITINGLPILELDPMLDIYYQNNVIGGPNAFLVTAAAFEEFADAISKKLVTEIAAHGPLPLKVGAKPAKR